MNEPTENNINNRQIEKGIHKKGKKESTSLVNNIQEIVSLLEEIVSTKELVQ